MSYEDKPERASGQYIALKPRPKVEMLPCPWCGFPPRLTGKRFDAEPRTLYWYVCSNATCEVAKPLGHSRIETAQADWNQRQRPNAERSNRRENL